MFSLDFKKMVHKKYIIKKGKKFGPYLYENYRENGKTKTRYLGKYKEKDVILKKGKYGNYISYNGKNSSIKHIRKEYNIIGIEDIVGVLEGKVSSNPNVIRKISDEISIRKGKYGPYVMYINKDMKKPQFIKIKGIEHEDIALEWVYDNLKY